MERFRHSEIFFEETKSTGLGELFTGGEEEKDAWVLGLNNGQTVESYTEE